jgi:methylglutaconyl-CoA hydratase
VPQLVDPPLQLRIENRIGRLVLERPAFTSDTLSQFLSALARAAAEADVLLISGSGNDFSLGRDRQEPKPASPSTAFELITRVNEALSAFPGVAVCAVHGRAFGFALGIVMRSDIALATDDARFALDEVRLGIPPMFIMAEILEHLAPKRALDIVLSSREFGAAEAKDIGLVSRVVPSRDLRTETESLLQELRARDAEVLKASKRYLASVRRVPLEARGAYALAEQTRYATQGKH